MVPPPPISTLFPYTTLFRSHHRRVVGAVDRHLHRARRAVGGGNGESVGDRLADVQVVECAVRDRKSTRLNSSHRCISYAVFCLKKKKESKIQSALVSG